MSTAQGFDTMSQALAEASNYHRWVFDLLAPRLGRRIVECGTGCGILTRQLLETGAERIWSLDISQQCLDALAGVAQASGGRLSLERMDLNDEDAAGRLQCQGVDTVVCINVLEHLGDDSGFVERMARLLAPGGRLLLFVPAFMALYGPMDRAAGHHRRYTRAQLRALAEAAGLEVELCRYVNPVGFLGWFVTNRVLRVEGLNAPSVNANIRLFDRWLVGLSRLLTPLAGNLFGQSAFAVARRKESAQ